MENILKELRALLQANADPEVQKGSGRFFKESVTVYGVKTVIVKNIGRQIFASIKDRPKDRIFALCEELWRSGYLEESFIACDWSYYVRQDYLPADFSVFESWVDAYVDNWASCDTLCNHSIGCLVEMYPRFVEHLKDWTRSANRWKKRAAAVTLILPARKGLFLEAIFDIADSLLSDPDDLVQKGYGWMLKAASEAHQDAVFDFVVARKASMPRTAYRYALEKMPPERRSLAMKK